MRKSKFTLLSNSYAVLACARLALGEPAARVTATLDEYAALLEILCRRQISSVPAPASCSQ